MLANRSSNTVDENRNGVARYKTLHSVPRNDSVPYHSLAFAGYLDIARYPEFRAAFSEAPPAVDVLVDLSGATGVDSIFLSELLLFKRRRRPLAVVVLVQPGTHVARIFTRADVGEKMDVFGDRASALNALER